MWYLLSILTLSLIACGGPQTITVGLTPDQWEARMAALESLLALNSQNDALLLARVEALEANDTTLANELASLNIDITNFVNTQIASLGIGALEARVLAVESMLTTMQTLTSTLATRQELSEAMTLISSIYATKAMLDAVEGSLRGLVTTLDGRVTSLESLVGSSGVVMVKAPCANAKEVFIRTNGKYYADMNILNTTPVSSYLAELAVNVTYKTTDGANCRFKVDNNGALVAL